MLSCLVLLGVSVRTVLVTNSPYFLRYVMSLRASRIAIHLELLLLPLLPTSVMSLSLPALLSRVLQNAKKVGDLPTLDDDTQV